MLLLLRPHVDTAPPAVPPPPWFLDMGLFLDTGLYLDATAPVPEAPVITAARTERAFARPAARLSVLASLGGPVLATFEGDDQRIESGSVTSSLASTVRRSGSLVLGDLDGSLTPRQLGDLFQPGTRTFLRCERGLYVDGIPDFVTLATLVVERFRSSMTGRLSLDGKDPFSLLAQPFGDAVTVPANTTAEDALRLLWVDVLDRGGGGEDWPLDGGGRLMPLRPFLPDEDRLDAVVRYFAASGLEVFSDRLGRPLMRPVRDIAQAATVATVRDYRPGADAELLTLERSGGRRGFNRVIVESNAPGGPDLRVVLDVTDPASPLHKDRVGGIRAAPVYRSAQIPDLAAANSIARSLLTEYALVTDTTSGTAIPDITLEAGDVVTIEEPVSGTTGRYRLESVTLPITTGAMSISAGRVVPLLLTGDEG